MRPRFFLPSHRGTRSAAGDRIIFSALFVGSVECRSLSDQRVKYFLIIRRIDEV